MKRFLLLIVPCILVACGYASSNLNEIQTATSRGMETYAAKFVSTKMFQLTAESETITAGFPKNDATITAIMASKYAGGTAVAATMSAMPTLTLTPTIPPESLPCSTKDLRANYEGAMGATQSLTIGVGLTNIGKLPCFLEIRPQAVLVDQNGIPLDIQYSFSSDTPLDPHAKLGLPPGRMAGFMLWWGNWCLPIVKPAILVRLTLAGNGGTFAVPTNLTGGPVCSDPGNKSWAEIFPFTMP